MTRVSKRTIENSEYSKLFKKFVEIIEISGSSRGTKNLIYELLTHSERIMLVKRFAVICMVIDEIPDRVIADSLAVSTSTVGRIIDSVEKGEYRYIKSLLKRNKESLVDLIERIYFILPPKVGRKRYRYVRQGKFSI